PDPRRIPNVCSIVSSIDYMHSRGAKNNAGRPNSGQFGRLASLRRAGMAGTMNWSSILEPGDDRRTNRPRIVRMRMAVTRERLHELVEQIPDAALGVAAEALQRIARDPVAEALNNAPVDDEPLTAEELAGLAEAEADIAAGRVFTTEEARRRLVRRR